MNEVIFLGKIFLSSLNEGKEMILMMIMIEGVIEGSKILENFITTNEI